jgi:hypothetical protein
MPIDPETTADMVEEPNGSNTGQDESQRLILSNAIIKKRRKDNNDESDFDIQDHTLNTTHCSMSQSWDQVVQPPKTIQNCKVRSSNPQKYRRGNDGDQPTSNDKGASPIIHCPMCFRLFHIYQGIWFPHTKKQMSTFIDEYWQTPSYQDVIKANISHLEEEDQVSICQYCSAFIRMHVKQISKDKSKKPKHPMDMAVDFILSGGSTPSPCNSVLNHCMESLVYNFPSNPILQAKNCDLYDMVQAIMHHIHTFEVKNSHEFINFGCFLKWIFNGRQRMIKDAESAKIIRRYLSDHSDQEKWWSEKVPTSACRFCSKSPASVIPSSFCSVLWTGTSIQQSANIHSDLEKIESTNICIDNMSIFCCKCCRFSVISYDYHTKMRNVMGLLPIKSEDAYYSRLLCIYKNQQKVKHQ